MKQNRWKVWGVLAVILISVIIAVAIRRTDTGTAEVGEEENVSPVVPEMEEALPEAQGPEAELPSPTEDGEDTLPPDVFDGSGDEEFLPEGPSDEVMPGELAPEKPAPI